jgi:hypothetical protein
MQNLHQSPWDHAILYAARPSKDEQVLIKLFFVKKHNYEHGWQMEVKIHSFLCVDKL